MGRNGNVPPNADDFIPYADLVHSQIAGKIAQPSFTSERLEAAFVDGKISARDWWEIEMTSSQLFVGQCGLRSANDAVSWLETDMDCYYIILAGIDTVRGIIRCSL